MHTAALKPVLTPHPFSMLLLSMALGLVGACKSPHEGLGLGRPEFTGRGHEGPSGIALVRLVPPDPQNSGAAYVHLVNNGNTTLDTSLNRLWLQTIAGSITLPEMQWAPGESIWVQGAALSPLDLHGTAGELMVLGESLDLEAYACWGADPNTLPGGLGRLAQSQGLPALWQPLPYPLGSGVAINLQGAPGAPPCVVADLNATLPLAAADCQGSAGAGALYLSRVQPTGIDAQGPAVEIYNPGPQALDLMGVQLCARGQCQPIVPLNQSPRGINDTWLPGVTSGLATGAADAARRRIVLMGGSSLSPQDLVTSLPGVASVDEVALLAPGHAVSEGASVLSYARLSTAPSVRPGPTVLSAQMGHAAAVAQWQNVTVQAPLLPGETLALKVAATTGPSSPSSWTLDASPFGTVLADGNAPYNACSAPAQPRPRSALALAQVTSVGADGVVFLLNTTDELLSLDGYTLAQGANASLSLASALLASGSPLHELMPHSLLRVAVSANMHCPEPYNLCWSDPEVSLDAGELTVLLHNSPVAHVQWGTTSLTSLGGAQAQAAGIWPMASCRIKAFTGEPDNPASMVLLPGRPGTSPADYGFGAQAVGTDIYVANP